MSGELEGWDPKKSELEILTKATIIIARNPDASSTLEAPSFEYGRRKIRATFKFKTLEARKAQDTLDKIRLAIEASGNAQHKRVLMVFTRTDVGDVAIGKKSGERVVIEGDRRTIIGSDICLRTRRTKTQARDQGGRGHCLQERFCRRCDGQLGQGSVVFKASNLAASTLRAKLNRGETTNAAEEFPKWRFAEGKVLAGLVRRRAAERILFERQE